MLPKLNCVFHTTETLTNFCTQSNCLLPLCPSCIKIHTAEHVTMRTIPQYQQINHLLGHIAADIRKCSRVLEGDLEHMKSITVSRQQIKDQVHQCIAKVRQELTDIMDNYFEQMYVQVEESFKGDNLSQPIEKFRKMLNREITTLNNLENSIYTNRAMRTVIKWKGEDMQTKTTLAHTINEEFIDKCQLKNIDFKPNSDYKEQFKGFLNANVSCLLNITNNKINMEPLDITFGLQTTERASQTSSPGHHRSLQADSEQRKSKPGIRLIGLENQLDLLDSKKGFLNKRVKISNGVPLVTQKQNVSDYRSIKAFHFMGDSFDRK